MAQDGFVSPLPGLVAFPYFDPPLTRVGSVIPLLLGLEFRNPMQVSSPCSYREFSH